MILSLVMPVPVIAAIPAGVMAAIGKGAATIGGSVIGGVATYAIVDAAKAIRNPRFILPSLVQPAPIILIVCWP